MQKKIKKIVSSKVDYVILLLAIVLATGLMFYHPSSREIGALQGASLEIIGRLVQPFSSLRRWGQVQEENSRLRYQNAMLQIRNSQLAEAHFENLRLREMVGFAETTPMKLLATRIIGSSGPAAMNTIVLNVGYGQGVRENMPLVSADGLVGKIITVSTTHSIAQLLTDRSFRVAALVQRSRVQGVFQWEGFNSGLLTGVYLSADVKVGDWVVTSGQNSLFPLGLKIGVVSQIDAAHAGFFQRIYVKPRLDFSRLEEVFVILDAVQAEVKRP